MYNEDRLVKTCIQEVYIVVVYYNYVLPRIINVIELRLR